MLHQLGLHQHVHGCNLPSPALAPGRDQLQGSMTSCNPAGSGPKHAGQCRKDADVAALLQQEGTVLHELQDRVTVIHDPVQSDISSTTVRAELAQVGLHPLTCTECTGVVLFVWGGEYLARCAWVHRDTCTCAGCRSCINCVTSIYHPIDLARSGTWM